MTISRLWLTPWQPEHILKAKKRDFQWKNWTRSNCQVKDRLLTEWKGCSGKLVSPEFPQNFQIWGFGSKRGACQPSKVGLLLWQPEPIRLHPRLRRLSKIQTSRWLFLWIKYHFRNCDKTRLPGVLDFSKTVSQMSKLVAGVIEWQDQAPPSTFWQGLHGTAFLSNKCGSWKSDWILILPSAWIKSQFLFNGLQLSGNPVLS